MPDENWLKFEQSGSVADYLIYKKHKSAAAAVLDEKAEKHAGNNKSACNKRTVGGGE